jgi:hypothetical protein
VSSRSLYQPEPTLNNRTSRSASYLPTRALLTSLTNPPAGTPQSYIQERFRQGQDRELSLMKTLQLTEDEKEEMKEQTKICEVIGRQQHGPHVENAARRTPHAARRTPHAARRTAVSWGRRRLLALGRAPLVPRAMRRETRHAEGAQPLLETSEAGPTRGEALYSYYPSVHPLAPPRLPPHHLASPRRRRRLPPAAARGSASDAWHGRAWRPLMIAPCDDRKGKALWYEVIRTGRREKDKPQWCAAVRRAIVSMATGSIAIGRLLLAAAGTPCRRSHPHPNPNANHPYSGHTNYGRYPMSEIELTMPSYVLKLIKNYDDKANALASGLAIRPLTAAEILAHLEDFGIDSTLAHGKVRQMSGGQRCRRAAIPSMQYLVRAIPTLQYLLCNTYFAIPTLQYLLWQTRC